MRGLAADLNAGSPKSNRELYNMIKSMVLHKELVLDQCINECRGGSAWQWIHIGLRENKKDYRNKFFSLANFQNNVVTEYNYNVQRNYKNKKL